MYVCISASILHLQDTRRSDASQDKKEKVLARARRLRENTEPASRGRQGSLSLVPRRYCERSASTTGCHCEWGAMLPAMRKITCKKVFQCSRVVLSTLAHASSRRTTIAVLTKFGGVDAHLSGYAHLYEFWGIQEQPRSRPRQPLQHRQSHFEKGDCSRSREHRLTVVRGNAVWRFAARETFKGFLVRDLRLTPPRSAVLNARSKGSGLLRVARGPFGRNRFAPQ